jgi:hypothetical protein
MAFLIRNENYEHAHIVSSSRLQRERIILFVVVLQGFELRAFTLFRLVLLPHKPLHSPFFLLGIFKIGS